MQEQAAAVRDVDNEGHDIWSCTEGSDRDRQRRSLGPAGKGMGICYLG